MHKCFFKNCICFSGIVNSIILKFQVVDIYSIYIWCIAVVYILQTAYIYGVPHEIQSTNSNRLIFVTNFRATSVSANIHSGAKSHIVRSFIQQQPCATHFSPTRSRSLARTRFCSQQTNLFENKLNTTDIQYWQTHKPTHTQLLTRPLNTCNTLRAAALHSRWSY